VSPRGTLVVALGLLGAHAALLRVAAEWSFVAALLSPGPHSGPGALLFGVAFLATRLLVYVVLPALAAAALGFHSISWVLRRLRRVQTSPTHRPGPMLSGPAPGAEVVDDEARSHSEPFTT